MRFHIIAVGAVLLVGCNSEIETAPETDPETAWKSLTTTAGCLASGQRSTHGRGDASCFSEPPWLVFLTVPSNEKFEFLFSRFSSMKRTAIHVCPFQDASEGELAVFAVQVLTKKLWTNYDGPNAELTSKITAYKAKIDRDGIGDWEHAVLRGILSSDPERNALITYFK